MAEVILKIGDRQHRIACKAGSEDQVRQMGAMIDARWGAAHRASGGLNAERSMLFVALMLADALDDVQRKPTAESAPAPVPADPAPAAPAPTIDETALNRIAERIEAIAAALENRPATP